MYSYLGESISVDLWCPKFSFPEANELKEKGIYAHITGSKKIGKLLSLNIINRIAFLALPNRIKHAIRQGQLEFSSQQIGVGWELYLRFRKKNVKAIFCTYLKTFPEARIASWLLKVPLFFDTIDVQYKRREEEEKRKIQSWCHDVSAVQEIACWRQADVLLAIQHEESELMKVSAPDSLVITVEHSPTLPQQISNQDEPKSEKLSLLCVGSSAKPNVHGLSRFIQSQWPVLHETHPEVVFNVVGSVCEHIPDDYKRLAGIRWHGFVDDLDSFYANATVVINPVEYGTGLKIKTVEAITHGSCLITTPAGAQGLKTYSGLAFVMTEAENLAQVCIDLLSKKEVRESYCRGAQDCYQKRFAPEVCYAELLLTLQQFIKEG